MDIIETERLTLREFTLNDTGFILQLLNSAGWLQFIGDRGVRTEKDAAEYLNNGPLKSYREHGFGLLLVSLKNDNTPLGMCGLLKRDSLEHPDIGFAFLPQFTGKGYAFEAATAILQYAKDQLKIPVVYAITDRNNNRSIELLQKVGLHFRGMVKLSHEPNDLKLFATSDSKTE